MPVLNRAERSRTGVVFVALLIAICATGAAAREFRAADTQTEDDPTVQALRFTREKWRHLEEQSQRRAQAAGIAIVSENDRKPFEDAMAAIYAKAGQDPAAAALIERIRKVE